MLLLLLLLPDNTTIIGCFATVLHAPPLHLTVLPWLCVSLLTSTPGAAASSAAAAGTSAATGPAIIGPAGISAEYDLSGAWVVDQSRSDSLEPFLRALNAPWVARKVAMGLTVCNNVLHTPDTLTLIDKSSLFQNRTIVWLDGVARDRVGDDGKTAIVRSWFVTPTFTPPADAPIPMDPQGRVPGTLVFICDLPDNLGWVLCSTVQRYRRAVLPCVAMAWSAC